MDIKQQIRDTLEDNTAVDIDFILLEPLVDQLSSLFDQLLQESTREQREKLNPEYPNLIPVLTKTDEWYKAHEAMGAEIVFSRIYDDEDGERTRPIRAIYQSPIVKFQEVMKLSYPSQENK